MKLYRYVDHQRLHIVTKDVISLSISVLLLFRHYISHKITFGAPSSGGVLRSACGAFIILIFIMNELCSKVKRAHLSTAISKHDYKNACITRLGQEGNIESRKLITKILISDIQLKQ